MPISYARVIARGLGLADDDCTELLQGTGLAPGDLAAPDRAVSGAQQLQVIANALRLSGDPGLGLRVGALAPLSTHGALGHAAVSSGNLAAALDLVQRYMRTRAGFYRLDVRRHGGEARAELRESHDLGPARLFLHEALMLTLQALVDVGLGPRVAGVRIEFGYPAPPHAGAYEHAFHMPHRFGARVTRLCIDEALMQRRFVTADRRSLEAAEAQCAGELATQALAVSFVDGVRAAIADRLADGCTIELVARDFGISSRTLVRRLAEQGVHYRRVLEQVRKETAQRRLAGSGMPIAELAQQLGYKDPSNLGRACRAWFGMSPSDYRERHAAGRGDAIA
jgi:AraC-like DNA-binding protein